MLCFHGSPQLATDVITDETPDDEIAEMIGDSPQRFLAGGHTHVPLVRRFGNQTIVNPGSVGHPFAGYGFAGEVPVMNHAAYGVINATTTGTSFEFRQVPYDLGALADAVEHSGMPHGDWWLSQRASEQATPHVTSRVQHL